jgi:hypothetical protein
VRMTSGLAISFSSAVVLAALIWFVSVQARWFHARLGMTLPRALGLSVWLWVVAAGIITAVGAVVIV